MNIAQLAVHYFGESLQIGNERVGRADGVDEGIHPSLDLAFDLLAETEIALGAVFRK
jgi:hypothetical protein